MSSLIDSMEHLSLYELNKQIGEVLAKNLEPSYWVVAEIGEMRQNQKGHCYLELVEKEEHQIKAKARATIWSYTYRNLSAWFERISGQVLKPGMKILCNVTIQYHEVYGFSLNIRDIDAQYTLGERAKRRQEIIEKLQSDGIFDMNREQELPLVPQRIAVISSETAAGYGDFLDQLHSNEYGYQFEIELFNSIMQGDQAESSIIKSMHEVFERVENFDLLVIIRGGGASLDLDCFDSYELGSHIAQFPLPVITGIGHERDETIADLVAHTKMKTPTAVAEFIISGTRNFEQRIDDYFNVLIDVLKQAIENEVYRIDQSSYRLYRKTQQILKKEDLEMNNLTHALTHGFQNVLRSHDHKLTSFADILVKGPAKSIDQQYLLLNHLEQTLRSLDPKNVLGRGYSLTLINGVNIHKLKNLKEDSALTTITHKLELQSRLLSIRKRQKK